jgi:deoxyribodipyrimidine photolyase-related protein
LNREEALTYLDHFIEQRLLHFGRFQDAMVLDQPFLFHSLLSFALNTKMISPREVIMGAVEAYRQGTAPLNAVEGFVRQILGWREYVRCFYWAHGLEYQAVNYFNHQRQLPEWFWTGKTKMRCLAQAIGQSLDHAYAHHIHRLMIIGNAALLFGLSPQAVSQWYLGVYIDAFEWVEQPNTLGMSQFADGGLLATKPYVASAAYVNRMSNYCKGCSYQFKLREEENACPLNALYWHFHYIHRDQLMKNHRLSMVYRQWQRFDERQQQAILQRAETLLNDWQTC